MQDQFKLVRDDYTNIEKAFDGDLWKRKELGNRLTEYVSRLKIGATIAIDAEWGSGKTWFVNHWKKQLEDGKFDVIYLDAFANDYLEDPFLTISMEIANKINVDPALVRKFKEKLTSVYHSILPNLPILLWSLGTSIISASYFGKTAAEVLKNSTENVGDFGEESAKLLNEKLKEHLSAQVENYEQEKQTLIYFKKALAEIAEKLDHPLVFIIDELDRCKPEFSIRLIERIKHFFDTPNIIFVLAVNKKQL
jgi:predicted KAP-like P-loop ATPase